MQMKVRLTAIILKCGSILQNLSLHYPLIYRSILSGPINFEGSCCILKVHIQLYMVFKSFAIFKLGKIIFRLLLTIILDEFFCVQYVFLFVCFLPTMNIYSTAYSLFLWTPLLFSVLLFLLHQQLFAFSSFLQANQFITHSQYFLIIFTLNIVSDISPISHWVPLFLNLFE